MAATDYDWQSSRNGLIERALRMVGALSLGEPLSADQYTQALIALNDMVKSWQTEHEFSWTFREQSVTITGGLASVAIPTDPPPILIDSAWWVNGTNWEPIEVVAFRDYESISNKAEVGEPSQLAFDYRSTLYVYPVPATNQTVKLFSVTRIQDFDTSTSTAGFPARWSEALVFNLAHLMSFEYPIELGEFDRIEKKAIETLAKAKKTDHGRGQRNFVRGAFG